MIRKVEGAVDDQFVSYPVQGRVDVEQNFKKYLDTTLVWRLSKIM